MKLNRYFFTGALLLFLIFVSSCSSSSSNRPDTTSDNNENTGSSVNIADATVFYSSIFPNNGSSGIPIHNSIQISFKEVIDASRVSIISSHSLTGTLTTNGNSVIYSPSSVFNNSTTYIFTITAPFKEENKEDYIFTLSFTTASENARYISPNGCDCNDGQTPESPWLSFVHAFSHMTGGDELVLLDGVYSSNTKTGVIHWDIDKYGNTSSNEIPNGNSLSDATHIHAMNPGNVTVDGLLFMGRTFRKDSYITIEGITFEGGGDLYNTSYVTVKNSGFHGLFGIGSNDHNDGNSYNLIEDVWIWAKNERIIAINYRSDFNVWRRVLVRGDGCNQPECFGSGNPNVGITVYESKNVSLQNVIVIDRILDGGEPYSDFATAQHTDGNFELGLNTWLGCLSVNSEDTALYFEADNVIPNKATWDIQNFVAVDANYTGLNIGNLPATGATPNIVENVTIINVGGDGVRVSPGQNSSTVRNIIVTGAGDWGINSSSAPSYALVHNTTDNPYNQTNCSISCFSGDPQLGTPRALLYPLRVESGSILSGSGESGRDIGANVRYRYGLDSTRYGDANFDTLTSDPLWPWPNEKRIKIEMCKTTSRGFCSNGFQLDGETEVTLTSYIWEYLGNTTPDTF